MDTFLVVISHLTYLASQYQQGLWAWWITLRFRVGNSEKREKQEQPTPTSSKPPVSLFWYGDMGTYEVVIQNVQVSNGHEFDWEALIRSFFPRPNSVAIAIQLEDYLHKIMADYNLVAKLEECTADINAFRVWTLSE